MVYRARHAGLKRLTALKLLRGGPAADPREAARLRRRPKRWRIGHPNIIQIYEVGETAGRPYVALEFAPAAAWQALRHAPSRPAPRPRCVEALARAVHAAHRAGVVHRDLKPANVLLDRRRHAQDRRLRPGQAARRRRRPKPHTGDIIGTPELHGPRAGRGRNATVGPAADVYALGAVLYELLTGRPPFQGETVWDTLEQVVGREPTPPRARPRGAADLETICLKCLHKDPARRYPGADRLADDLARFLAGRPVLARPTPAWEAPGSGCGGGRPPRPAWPPPWC